MIFLESSAVTDNTMSRNPMGFIPRSISLAVSSSQSEATFLEYMPVASIAKGESTKTWKSGNFGTRFLFLISRRKYSISCILPTAKVGITTLPPRVKVSVIIFERSAA